MLGRSHGEHELQAPKLEPAPMMKNCTSLKFVQTLFRGTVTVAGSLDCRNAGHNRNWSNQLRLLFVPDKIWNLCEIIKTNEQSWLNFCPHNCISSIKSCLQLEKMPYKSFLRQKQNNLTCFQRTVHPGCTNTHQPKYHVCCSWSARTDRSARRRRE